MTKKRSLILPRWIVELEDTGKISSLAGMLWLYRGRNGSCGPPSMALFHSTDRSQCSVVSDEDAPQQTVYFSLGSDGTNRHLQTLLCPDPLSAASHRVPAVSKHRKRLGKWRRNIAISTLVQDISPLVHPRRCFHLFFADYTPFQDHVGVHWQWLSALLLLLGGTVNVISCFMCHHRMICSSLFGTITL